MFIYSLIVMVSVGGLLIYHALVELQRRQEGQWLAAICDRRETDAACQGGYISQNTCSDDVKVYLSQDSDRYSKTSLDMKNSLF